MTTNSETESARKFERSITAIQGIDQKLEQLIEDQHQVFS